MVRVWVQTQVCLPPNLTLLATRLDWLSLPMRWERLRAGTEVRSRGGEEEPKGGVGWGGRQDSHSSCGLDQWCGILLTPVDPVDIGSMGEGISHGGKGWRMPSSSKQQGPRVQAAQVLRGWLC